jgi:hypothetical protein
MPIQTTIKGFIKYKDGAKVEILKSGGSWTDAGAIKGGIALTVDFTEDKQESGNAGVMRKQIKQMKLNGSFNLMNIDPTILEQMGGGLFTQINTAATPITTGSFTNQVFTGFVANTKIALLPIITATGKVMKFASAPVITSITGTGTGASGALAANNDYTVVVDTSAESGYSVVFNTSGTATVAITETITIVWGTNTPTARTTLTAGTSTKIITPYGLRFTHTDSAGLLRQLTIFSVTTNSGGFVFGFGGADEDGLEEMPISFTGDIDTSLTNEAQLFSYIEDVGAV